MPLLCSLFPTSKPSASPIGPTSKMHPLPPPPKCPSQSPRPLCPTLAILPYSPQAHLLSPTPHSKPTVQLIQVNEPPQVVEAGGLDSTTPTWPPQAATDTCPKAFALIMPSSGAFLLQISSRLRDPLSRWANATGTKPSLNTLLKARETNRR